MECSGSFGVKYEIHVPRSVDVGRLPIIQGVVARAAFTTRDKVRVERHDPGFMDPDDPQAEWVFGTLTQFVSPTDRVEMNTADRICAALYKHFGRERSVRLTNPGGTDCCSRYAQ